MQKISASTNTANPSGEFTEGSSAGGVPATNIKAAWLNSIQRELLEVLAKAGISPSVDNDGQLYESIVRLAAAAADFNKLINKPVTLAGYGIGDAFTKAQTSAEIKAAINALVNGAGASLDTLQELAAALGNDANFAATVTTALAAKAAKAVTLAGYGIADAYTKSQVDSALYVKAPLDSPQFVGAPKVVAVPPLDTSYRIASTQFVHEQTNALIQLDISGVGAYVLSSQDAMPMLYLYGTLTGDREIILPFAFRKYLVCNFVDGVGKVILRMATGSAVEVTRLCISGIFTDTVHTRLCQTDFASPIFTGTPKTPKAAKGTNSDQVASCSFVLGEVADKAAKATTLAGYGITDTYNAEYLNNWFAQKAAKATTLSGYGIADAYTAAQIDSKLSSKPNTEAVAVVGFVSGSTADPYFGSTTGELVRLVSKSKLPLNTCVRGVPGWWSCGDTGLLRQRVAVYIGDVNSVWTGSVTWPVAFPAQADSVKISIMTADGSVGLAVATYSSLTKTGCKIRVEEWGGLVQTGFQLIVEAEGY